MLVLDTHAHFYRNVAVATALEFLSNNLTRLAARFAGPQLSLGAFVLETARTWDFDEVVRQIVHAGNAITEFEDRSGAMVHKSGKSLLLFRGKQFKSAEGIELLTVAAPNAQSNGARDGETFQELCARFSEPHAILILPWSPGKWLGTRGTFVRRCLQQDGNHELFIGDIAIRPRLFPTPALMRTAQKLGFRFLAGSDPLPIAGDERVLGSYATALHCREQSPTTLEGLRAALLAGTCAPCGDRADPLTASMRMTRFWLDYLRGKMPRLL